LEDGGSWLSGVAVLRRVKPDLERHHARILNGTQRLFLMPPIFASTPGPVT
jgi:hypothetical protein